MVGYTEVMFQMQYLQVSFEAAYFSEHFDTSFEKIGLKMMLRRPKNYFGVGAKRGGLKKNGFTQILLISKAFKIKFMSRDTNLRSMSPFPLLK